MRYSMSLRSPPDSSLSPPCSVSPFLALPAPPYPPPERWCSPPSCLQPAAQRRRLCLSPGADRGALAPEQTAASTVGREGAEEFLRELNARFTLVKVEQLQLLNLRPRSPVEVHMIVEDCEERLSEEQVLEVIELSERLLG